ncbi:putative membrane protein [Chitinivorax tropicus]|uniref:Putative membrane protein n=1 Tax=Chitinivorax tropicus TaxID=714531 RepID=A0A840MJF6_9PROT|nr:BPSS1780 family membrane protein [Chitinivorax tropicus]MBB5016937.1 putative membrane protein [Chitinivorax tropicus]
MSNQSDNNPYAAPQSAVAPVGPTIRDDFGNFIPNGRSVPAGSAASWFGAAWELFKKSPMMWIFTTILFVLLSFIASIIPFFGWLAGNMLMPFLVGGMMIGCRTQEEGGDLNIDHLFAGKQHTGNLVMIGLIYIGFIVLIGIVVTIIAFGVFGGAALAAAFGSSQNDDVATAMALGGLGIGAILLFLIILALSIPLVMAVWFAPTLVVFNELKPFEAMKMSFKACLKNILPFFVYGLLYFVLMVLGMIPLLLGLLIVGPLILATLYTSYRDIFYAQ